MSENMQFGLVSQSSLIHTPQDNFTAISSDYTSIFGNHSKDYLKGISIVHSEENPETPFAYDNFMNDAGMSCNLQECQNNDFDFSQSKLTFEC